MPEVRVWAAGLHLPELLEGLHHCHCTHRVQTVQTVQKCSFSTSRVSHMSHIYTYCYCLNSGTQIFASFYFFIIIIIINWTIAFFSSSLIFLHGNMTQYKVQCESLHQLSNLRRLFCCVRKWPYRFKMRSFSKIKPVLFQGLIHQKCCLWRNYNKNPSKMTVPLSSY